MDQLLDQLQDQLPLARACELLFLLLQIWLEGTERKEAQRRRPKKRQEEALEEAKQETEAAGLTPMARRELSREKALIKTLILALILRVCEFASLRELLVVATSESFSPLSLCRMLVLLALLVTLQSLLLASELACCELLAHNI